jgi:hypothetical protein
MLETDAYDPTEKGRPWAAKVTFETLSGEFHWGDFVGNCGEPGLRVLPNVEPGDIIALGQKDWAEPHLGQPTFHVLNSDGTLTPFPGRKDAYLYWLRTNSNPN